MSEQRDRVAVFLLAENRLLREALVRIFNKKNDIEMVGACGFTPLAVEEIAAASPDVLLMDSFTVELSHLEFIREVQRAVPGLKVVMIGMESEEQTFLQVVRAGAVGYVLKDASAQEVVTGVRAAANGEAVCPPQLCLCLLRYVARQWNQVPSFQVKASLGLTNREQQLVLLIGRGLTNKEIAMQLNLSEQTVRNHVHHMLRKVGASDRLQVVELCRIQGLAV
jgi:NarL family two-component system response regulator LiaR